MLLSLDGRLLVLVLVLVMAMAMVPATRPSTAIPSTTGTRSP
jgi:hypothetical protein